MVKSLALEEIFPGLSVRRLYRRLVKVKDCLGEVFYFPSREVVLNVPYLQYYFCIFVDERHARFWSKLQLTTSHET